MPFITDVFAGAEMASRRDRIRADFARVGRLPRAPRGQSRPIRLHGPANRHGYRPVRAGG